MLVLTRKKGESIVINDGVEVTVANILGDKVRLVVNAPDGIPVVQREMFGATIPHGSPCTVRLDPHEAKSRGGSGSSFVFLRHRDEGIVIGDNVVVTIVDIRGDKVRLGIDAPTEIPVHRREVYEAIQRENLRASQLDPRDARGLGGTRRSGSDQQ